MTASVASESGAGNSVFKITLICSTAYYEDGRVETHFYGAEDFCLACKDELANSLFCESCAP